ncbi:MAG: hypothetical protein HOP28_17840, partial [Gemmatimonadales bacterium]|nr:hypothetical protein [Gemmatimonadales bacterium]
MTHEDALELAGRALDGPLAAADRAALEAHLAECAPCRTETAALAGIHAALSAWSAAPSGANGAIERVVARVGARLAAAALIG